jgi:hypothetical protein
MPALADELAGLIGALHGTGLLKNEPRCIRAGGREVNLSRAAARSGLPVAATGLGGPVAGRAV